MRPVKYDVCCFPVLMGGIIDPGMNTEKAYQRVTIDARNHDGSKWSICYGNECFSKSKFDFVYEPSPSNRDDSFIEDTRFDSAQEAYDFWNTYWEYYAYKYPPAFRFVDNSAGGVMRIPITDEDIQKHKKAKAFYTERGLYEEE